MRALRLTVLSLVAGLAALGACSGPLTSTNNAALLGTWGSTQASLTVADTGASLLILASGNCYGSLADVGGPLATPAFDLSGSYTQLTGAFPGKIQYPAQVSGAVAGEQMSLTVTVPSLHQAFGPYFLTHGVHQTWPACAYPAAPAAGP